MTIAKELFRCQLVVELVHGGRTGPFRYLGTHDPAKDLRSQINKTSALSGRLRDVVWSNPYMHTSKIRIYKTCIRPIMTYDTNKTKSILSVAETLRIVGKTTRDRVRNTDTREQCGIQDVVRWGRQRRRQ